MDINPLEVCKYPERSRKPLHIHAEGGVYNLQITTPSSPPPLGQTSKHADTPTHTHTPTHIHTHAASHPHTL